VTFRFGRNTAKIIDKTQGSPSLKPIEIHLLSMGFLFERLSFAVRLEEEVQGNSKCKAINKNLC
jgi:hypothetical protein